MSNLYWKSQCLHPNQGGRSSNLWQSSAQCFALCSNRNPVAFDLRNLQSAIPDSPLQAFFKVWLLASSHFSQLVALVDWGSIYPIVKREVNLPPSVHYLTSLRSRLGAYSLKWTGLSHHAYMEIYILSQLVWEIDSALMLHMVLSSSWTLTHTHRKLFNGSGPPRYVNVPEPRGLHLISLFWCCLWLLFFVGCGHLRSQPLVLFWKVSRESSASPVLR